MNAKEINRLEATVLYHEVNLKNARLQMQNARTDSEMVKAMNKVANYEIILLNARGKLAAAI